MQIKKTKQKRKKKKKKRKQEKEKRKNNFFEKLSCAENLQIFSFKR